ncbi:hypothetical protein LARI1_G004261 [Lachnellula arida]|uniref:Uncharacterized protein n=1 Tax=Lachnellula arida TaxID=1316785 RepID=A0A8T9BJ08_9HELO|nr:hypothetical protein LARI1_G004261 [Lachnellula arida]
MAEMKVDSASKKVEQNSTISGLMNGVPFVADIIECTSSILSWTGRSGPPIDSLFRGTRVFRIEPSQGGTILAHEENFVGVMAWALSTWLPLGWVTWKQFRKFNIDLKKEAEKQ